MCCAGNVVWCSHIELWWWDVECQCNTLSLRHLAPRHIIPPHFTLHHLTIPRHTIIPHHIAHFISHQHLSQHTIPLCNTIFKIAPLISATLCITPHQPLALHLILHYVPHNATFHVLHATFKITPYHWPHYASHHHISPSHHILHNWHSCGTAFRICIIPPHQSDHTQSTAHNIPHHTSVHHHIIHPTTKSLTSRTTPPPLPHCTTFHWHFMPQHSHKSILHHHFP